MTKAGKIDRMFFIALYRLRVLLFCSNGEGNALQEAPPLALLNYNLRTFVIYIILKQKSKP
jgi:hypothetical protein